LLQSKVDLFDESAVPLHNYLADHSLDRNGLRLPQLLLSLSLFGLLLLHDFVLGGVFVDLGKASESAVVGEETEIEDVLCLHLQQPDHFLLGQQSYLGVGLQQSVETVDGFLQLEGVGLFELLEVSALQDLELNVIDFIPHKGGVAADEKSILNNILLDLLALVDIDSSQVLLLLL
jgi:hypothetical protein